MISKKEKKKKKWVGVGVGGEEKDIHFNLGLFCASYWANITSKKGPISRLPGVCKLRADNTSIS